jgi:Tfp pilus assembly pilus retraction ATPase PilT
VLASLIAALEVTGADRIVLRPGELPHLIRADRRHPLSTAGVLTIETVERFVEQALSPEGRQALAAQDFVVEALPRDASSLSVLVAARRTGRDIYVELRSDREARPAAITPPAPPVAPITPPAPEPLEVEDEFVDAPEVPSAVDVSVESPAVAAPASDAASTPMRIVSAPSASDETIEQPTPEVAAKPEPVPLAFKRRAPAFGSGQSVDAALLEQWIDEAVRQEATALYLRPGQAPVMRAREGLKALATEPLHASDINAMVSALAVPATEWRATGEGGWTREFDEIGHVRCQTFTDTSGTGLAVLLSAHTSAATLQKDIPRHVRRLCEKADGLVIVAAATPAAVMQMVAALAETTAEQRAGYLISIEPPTGLGHVIAGPLVSARRLGGTEQEIAAAILRATDEGPDALVVTIASGAIAEASVGAAASGCLVIVGVIAATAQVAIEALSSSVKGPHADAFRRALAATFQCAFSYRTIRGVGGRAAIVHDVILGTPDVRARIEYGDFVGLQQVQRSGGGGMHSLDAGLAAAVLRSDLSLRQAAGWADDRRELVRLVRQGARHRRMMRAPQPADTDDAAFRAAAGDSFTT